MALQLVQSLMWVLVIFVQIHGHKCCLEEERIGLLDLKKAFLESNSYLRGFSAWNIDDPNSECCAWKRIKCDSTTGRVIQLSLNNLKPNPYVKDFPYFDQHPFENVYEKRWSLNVSLFQPFKELRGLDLSNNAIGVWIANKGFDKLQSLRNLEILDLSFNCFDDSNILQSLGAMVSLKSLNLSHNHFEGHFPAQELIALRNLEELDISFNHYIGCLPMQGLERLAVLKKLETLNLNGNSFGKSGISIVSSISALTSLRSLRLGDNGFESDQTFYEPSNRTNKIIANFESFSILENLETLELGGNNFELISLLRSLSAVKSLKNLNLRSTRLFRPELIQDQYRHFSGDRFDAPRAEVYEYRHPFIRAEDRGPFRPATEAFESFPAEALSALKNLEKLDLSNNGLNGYVPSTGQGCRAFSKLSKLTHLDLSHNKNSIRCLGALPALKSLNLAWNQMKGDLPIGELANLSTLEILDMSSNSFTGRIPQSIGSLYSLKALLLSDNYLDGTLTAEELCRLTKLEVLDLYRNQLKGVLPGCLKNMTSLKMFDISANQFNGNFSDLLTGQTSLEYIDLSGNLFEGLFSFSSLANHSKLEVILFGSGNNKLEIETEDLLSWKPLFQLKVLVLYSCNLNKHTHDIPRFLFHQHELEEVNLSHNILKGDFPLWLLENNERLQILSLRNNCFTGRFDLPPDQYMDTISWIDVSENLLHGKLQENIGTISPLVEYLNLSKNNFEGNVPSSVGRWSYLDALDLSYNNFFGEVPRELIANCTYLSLLRLSNNRFHGEIFSKHFKLLYLYILKLNDNQFTGTLPEISIPFQRLQHLDISNNNMSGTIPRWIGNMSELKILSMSNNFFQGQIPCELRYMRLIDLSHNSLSGTLPACLNLGTIEHLLLRGNKLTGPILKVRLNSSKLMTLDIRDNNFSGTIPDEIGTLYSLRILLLRGNHFSGVIPNQLCQLQTISIMDLSMNSFYGKIPSCFCNISFGKVNSYYDFEPIDKESRRSKDFTYNNFVGKNVGIFVTDLIQDEPVEIQFTTKHRFDSFKSHILGLMSGLDLSCNNLTGKLPSELGQLQSIHALNLSYNKLTGSIPETFSNMSTLESLDLSHNNLIGEIPSTLVDLNFLEVFSVAHNNLSGRLPDTNQFWTFDCSSYEGNPFLCGQALDKLCSRVSGSHSTLTKFSNASGEKWYEVDHLVFFASFSVSYLIFFVTVVSILHINPYWKQQCFSVIEYLMYRCYFSALDTIRRLSNRLC